MALPHATLGQVLEVCPLGEKLLTARTAALFKSHDLEVMRLALHASKALPLHKVPGEITIHCLEGPLSVDVDGSTSGLEAGELVFLAGGAPHSVMALIDASALVTIALRP